MSQTQNNLLFLKGDEIVALLNGQEQVVLDAVKKAYQIHAKGDTSMPPNSYLKFPGKDKERIIAKAAWLGGDFNQAGLKWIASFPANITRNIERASATLILNSTETGHPTAVMESSVISAARTAASAALAAQQMYQRPESPVVGMIGCGLINFETLRYLAAVFPQLEQINLFDLNPQRAAAFAAKAKEVTPRLRIQSLPDIDTLIQQSSVIALATTAIHPFIKSMDGYQPGTVVLHTSLRDIVPEFIHTADNVADDIEQVCSNRTSLHLAEQNLGHRNFIRTTIGDIFNGDAPAIDKEKDLHIFNPFGLGILDMAVGYAVQKLAIEQQTGMQIENFLPKPWMDR